jgi:hypothetical protein
MMVNDSTKRGPIFIAGPERSGTSLIFALLASHPNIAMSRRTNMWTHYYNQYGDLSNLDNFERCLTMMMRYKRLMKLNPNPDRIREEFWQGETTYGRLFSLLEEHYAEQLGKPRWGDKSLNTERYTDEIIQAYPNARIIHMIRDPRDRYSSSLARWKVSRGGIGAGTGIWINTITLAERFLKKYPNHYKTIRYEDLTDDPEKTLREICTFIDEPYADEMLSMDGAADFREKGGNSSYTKRKPGKITTSSIGKFRTVLNKHQVAYLQMFSKTTMKHYGYQLEEIKFTILDWARFLLYELPYNLARMVTWLGREAVLNRVGRNLPSERVVSEKEAVGFKTT